MCLPVQDVFDGGIIINYIIRQNLTPQANNNSLDCGTCMHAKVHFIFPDFHFREIPSLHPQEGAEYVFLWHWQLKWLAKRAIVILNSYWNGNFLSLINIENINQCKFDLSLIDICTFFNLRNLSDMKQEGKLNPEQFALAMYLVQQKQSGKDPPAALTPDMVPPSMRPKEHHSYNMYTRVLEHFSLYI